MVFGLGTDIVSIARGEQALREGGGSPPGDLFTAAEIALILQRASPAASCASRMAGKTAVAKALRPAEKLSLREIEILEDSFGAPTVTLSGAAARAAARAGVGRISISLSYEADFAAAVAVAEELLFRTAPSDC